MGHFIVKCPISFIYFGLVVVGVVSFSIGCVGIIFAVVGVIIFHHVLALIFLGNNGVGHSLIQIFVVFGGAGLAKLGGDNRVAGAFHAAGFVQQFNQMIAKAGAHWHGGNLPNFG